MSFMSSRLDLSAAARGIEAFGSWQFCGVQIARNLSRKLPGNTVAKHHTVYLRQQLYLHGRAMRLWKCCRFAHSSIAEVFN